jgi:hypothetical protein
MNRVFFDGRDLEIAIRREGIERIYPLASIAAALRVETAHLRARIESLLNAAEKLSTEEGLIVPSCESTPPGMLVGEPTEGTVPIRSDTDNGSVPTMVAAERGRDLDPETLAELLGDVPNTAAIAVLVRDVPASLISAALQQALAVPANRLRTNRAALFTAIVRRMRSGGAHPPRQHART